MIKQRRCGNAAQPVEIRRIRADTEAALGARFDIKAFHDAVLGHGPLPLATMREAVTRDLALSEGTA